MKSICFPILCRCLLIAVFLKGKHHANAHISYNEYDFSDISPFLMERFVYFCRTTFIGGIEYEYSFSLSLTATTKEAQNIKTTKMIENKMENDGTGRHERYVIENCANSAESAMLAQTAGADRVELCAGMPEGGTTPSEGEISVTRSHLTTTRLHVIIRPRGGDFCYSPVEQEVMMSDIVMARVIGADGIAVGCLTPEGDVDMEAMSKIMLAARGMSVTFHRAFDMCRNPFEALESLVQLGCDRILTSGQAPTAAEGKDLLRQLVDKAGKRIIIMPGCGVNAGNVAEIARVTGAHEFHLSARSTVDSRMKFRNPNVSMGGTVHIDEYSRAITDPKKILAVREALRQLTAKQE